MKVKSHIGVNGNALADKLANEATEFLFFLGGKDIHYINATITTSRECDVQLKLESSSQTTQLEFEML